MALTPGLTQTEMVDEDRFITQPWQVYLRDQQAVMATVPVREQVVQIPPVAVAIPPTSIATKLLASGLYRVTAAVRVTKPAAAPPASVSVTLHWYDGTPEASVSCTLLLIPPVTGNVTTAVGTGTAMIHSGPGMPISYSTTYDPEDSGMEYALHLVLETMGGE